MRVGIIGGGFVGRATCQLSADAIVYDIDPEKCVPAGVRLSDLMECELVFVCVPTPMNADGSCHLRMVDTAITSLRVIVGAEKIIIRSTVPVGTAAYYGVSFMPEFLREKSWGEDIRDMPAWILGTDHPYTRETLTRLLAEAKEVGRIRSSLVELLSPAEAELVKYGRNAFLATKVAFFNELCLLCEKKGLAFDRVRPRVADDVRIGHSHTHVPGHDQLRGFGGTCFPKDVHSLRHQFAQVDVPSPVLDAVLLRNETIDRIGEWKGDVGRAFVN